MSSRSMDNWFIEAYEDFTKTRKKCGTCCQLIWILLAICILLNGCGVAAFIYWNQTAAIIMLSLGITLGLLMCLGAVAICLGWCLRPERILPVSVGR